MAEEGGEGRGEANLRSECGFELVDTNLTTIAGDVTVVGERVEQRTWTPDVVRCGFCPVAFRERARLGDRSRHNVRQVVMLSLSCTLSMTDAF